MVKMSPHGEKDARGGKRDAAGGKGAKRDGAKTVTCPHCRYERPADDARCHICGFPWPWMRQ
jgi:hypothetical protein